MRSCVAGQMYRYVRYLGQCILVICMYHGTSTKINIGKSVLEGKPVLDYKNNFKIDLMKLNTLNFKECLITMDHKYI